MLEHEGQAMSGPPHDPGGEHVDEGTVHAWLDGQMVAADAARVEAHVAECPTCAALVAEARGHIAAATRIVNALDGVPARVMPRAPRRVVHRWHVRAAAAIVVMALGTAVVVRGPHGASLRSVSLRSTSPRPAAEQGATTIAPAPAGGAAGPAEQQQAPHAADRAAGPMAKLTPPSAIEAPRARRPLVSSLPSASPPLPTPASSHALGLSAKTVDVRPPEARAQASSVPAPAAGLQAFVDTVSPPAAATERALTAKRLEKGVPRLEAQVVTGTATTMASQNAANATTVVTDEAVKQVPAPTVENSVSRKVAGAAVSQEGPVAAIVPQACLDRDVPVTATGTDSAAPVAAVVHLTDVAGAPAGGTPGFIVRAVPDTTPDGIGRWEPIGRDSALIEIPTPRDTVRHRVACRGS